MTSFTDMTADFQRDLDAACARLDAVEAVRSMVELVAAMGFAPHVTCHKNDARDGAISIMIDLAAWSEPEPEPEGILTSVQDGGFRVAPDPAPQPVRREQAVARTDEGAGRTAPEAEERGGVSLVSPDPAPTPEQDGSRQVPGKERRGAVSNARVQAPAQAAAETDGPDELIKGPFSDAEKATIVTMVAGGASAGEIAARLSRPVGSINVMCRHLSAAIEAAQPAQEPATVKPAIVLGAAASGREKMIAAHLNALGFADGWTAARDLSLAEGLARGDGAGAVAEALGVEKSAAIARWRALNTEIGSIDHQARLLRVLRWRVELTEQKAG